ncbi:uncharacterized protein Tco025E_05294 [Trypanosoma conorhini]|uniref:Nuclear RNA export factor 1/2 n=1 Tax=Trypanosoma conorhini TaxID=83891 RepID=A0A422PEG2_9TRYP|nr:uncharacterized protein Tco025E_05294 [Trypanosoma conorhini]RNF16098.1 hypothetical protein Tco025E_05294 [Trypanosoma conorhini]
MLSSTGGYVKRSRVLGRHRDDATLCSTPCPALRVRGFCRSHARETSLRAAAAAEKEAELLRSATELFRLQEELLQDGAATDERQRAAAIASIVAELKREKSYENWSLDVAVAERMASLRLRRCPYSHRCELQAELRQPKRREKVGPGDAALEAKASWLQKKALVARRRRAFGALSPLQKCVACLLWQGCFEVPLGVVCDVRRRAEAAALARDCGEVDDAAVAAEERRVVSVAACRPSLGAVDLSSLPRLVAYVAQHPGAAVIRPETAAHFTGGAALQLPRGVTEKQIDLSSPACAHELVEAVVWSLRVMNDEAALQRRRQPPVMLRSLAVRRCAMTSADALVNALRKHRLDATLLALDMSDNRLMSLRFLFLLRAHFSGRLLRLSLVDNPITRKPEYREQVRKSLPRLTSLDGRAIRRPPLALPHPASVSYTFCTAAQPAQGRRVIAGEELDAVVDGLARFLYVWETRRVPWTVAELRHQRQQRRRRRQFPAEEPHVEADADDAGPQPPEEELDDDNFHHRYLHPSATFSMTLHEGLAFFDARTMRLATEVETDDAYAGMRLSPLDVRDLGVFDVAMKSNSRNLLMGRSVLHRFARGSLNCYAAYNYSLYPQRLEVCHHFGGAVVSVSKITDAAAPSGGGAAPAVSEVVGDGDEGRQQPQQRRRKKRRCEAAPSSAPSAAAAAATADAAAPFTLNAHSRKPTFYIVTFHGVMSWRAPSMKRAECVLAAYDRVMTFVENALPPTNPVEKRRSAPLLLFNDQVHLRPAAKGHVAWFMAQTEERVARLVVEYGLEACADGEALVRAVAERASSDAAASAALRLLVFGRDSGGAEGEAEEEAGHGDGVDAHAGGDAPAARHFDIFSLISAEKPAAGRDDDDDEEEEEVEEADIPHRVTLAQVEAAVAAMNRRHTAAFARPAPHGEGEAEAEAADPEATCN